MSSRILLFVLSFLTGIFLISFVAGVAESSEALGSQVKAGTNQNELKVGKKITPEQQDELRTYCNPEDTVYYAYYIGKDGEKKVAGYCCSIPFELYKSITFKNPDKVSGYNIKGRVYNAQSIKGYRTKSEGDSCIWRGPGVVCAKKIYAVPVSKNNLLEKILFSLNLYPEKFLAAASVNSSTDCAELKKIDNAPKLNDNKNVDLSEITKNEHSKTKKVVDTSFNKSADLDRYTYQTADNSHTKFNSYGEQYKFESAQKIISNTSHNTIESQINRQKNSTLVNKGVNTDNIIAQDDKEYFRYDLRNPLDRYKYMEKMRRLEVEQQNRTVSFRTQDRHPTGFSVGNIYIVPIIKTTGNNGRFLPTNSNEHFSKQESFLLKIKQTVSEYIGNVAENATPSVLVATLRNNDKDFQKILSEEGMYIAINSKYPDYLQNLASLERETALFTAYDALKKAKYKADLIKSKISCKVNQYASRCVLEKIKKAQQMQDKYFIQEVNSATLSTSTKMEIVKLYFKGKNFENIKTPFERYLKERLETSKLDATMSLEAKSKFLQDNSLENKYVNASTNNTFWSPFMNKITDFISKFK